MMERAFADQPEQMVTMTGTELQREDRGEGLRPGGAGLRPGNAGLRPGGKGLRPGKEGRSGGSSTPYPACQERNLESYKDDKDDNDGKKEKDKDDNDVNKEKDKDGNDGEEHNAPSSVGLSNMIFLNIFGIFVFIFSIFLATC